jgi:hypothetical protein
MSRGFWLDRPLNQLDMQDTLPYHRPTQEHVLIGIRSTLRTDTILGGAMVKRLLPAFAVLVMLLFVTGNAPAASITER